jgi:hypothetical protein
MARVSGAEHRRNAIGESDVDFTQHPLGTIRVDQYGRIYDRRVRPPRIARR